MEVTKRKVCEGATVERETVEPPYVLVRLVYCSPQKTFSAVGIAKCSPRDTWNEELGKAIARGRAVKEIVRKVRRAEAKPGLLLRGRDVPFDKLRITIGQVPESAVAALRSQGVW